MPEGPSDMILKGLGLQRGYFLGGRGQKQTLIKMRIHFLSKKKILVVLVPNLIIQRNTSNFFVNFLFSTIVFFKKRAIL